MEHTENHPPAEKTFLWWLWHIFFVLIYPVLVAFALVYTSLLWTFAAISRILSWVFKIFARRE